MLPNTLMTKAVKELLGVTLTELIDEKSPTVGVKKGTNVGLHPRYNPFVHNYIPSKDQLKDYPNMALFFLQNDLHQGSEMNLHFTAKNDKTRMFLPREIADSIPFSSNDLPQIYNRFSVQHDSVEAEVIKQTVNECKNEGIEGEEKYCATSLESMIDFVSAKLGSKVKAISTEVNAKENTSRYRSTRSDLLKRWLRIK